MADAKIADTNMVDANMADKKTRTPDPPQPGGFPRFADGDVLIRAGTGMYWKLHSANLKNASSKLKDMFEAVDGHKLSAKDKELGKMMRWTIDMVPWSEKPNDNRFRDLVISVSFPPYSLATSSLFIR